MSITWEEMKIKYPEGRNTMSEEREKTFTAMMEVALEIA